MAPSPHLHHDEEHDADGDVGRKENIADPQQKPALQPETDLGEDSAQEHEQGDPEAPSDGDFEVASDVHTDVAGSFNEWEVRVDVCLAFNLAQVVIEIRCVEVAPQNGKLDDEDDRVDELGDEAHDLGLRRSLLLRVHQAFIIMAITEFLTVRLFFAHTRA